MPTTQSFDAWIPEEWGGSVITKIRATSAVESYARREPMGSDVKHVPRSGGMSFVGAVPISTAYTEDGATNDVVTLTARKLGKVLRVAEEELRDTAQVANIIQTKQLDWARSYAVGFDNATLAVTASSANTTTVPYVSLYAALTAYNSASNVTQAGTGLGYTDLSNTFAKVEQSNFWSDGEMVVIAHPGYRQVLRNILDSSNRPIFNESSAGFAGGGQGGPVDTLFGMPIAWSLGAKTSAVSTDTPTGHPLLFIGNRNYIILGDRSGPEYMLAGADSGPAFLTDEALLKVRIRRGFVTGQEAAWSVLEKTA
jgi:HK97 family phage major capsid protein